MTKEKSFGPDIRKSYTYRELPIGATSIGIHNDVIKTGSWRVLRPLFKTKTAPCNEACPAGVDIRGFVTLMKDGRFDQAQKLYLEENPFPGICGRVCYHPCEEACNRKEFDQAVSINALERFIADSESRIQMDFSMNGRRIAIVGSGPAGLSASYFLARLGYQVTVFEALKEVGGLIRSGIPNYRLPMKVVEKELERLSFWGVQFITDFRIHQQNWQTLQEFDAILLAFGANKSLSLPFKYSGGCTLRILTGLQFLNDVKMGRKFSLGQKVAIVGGGNTAIDAARTVLRLGMSPTVIYRRSKAEMPAFHSEVEDAIEEGVQILYLTSPVGVDEQGPTLRIHCVRTRLGKTGKDKRPRPIPIEGSEFDIEAHAIISAVGETPDLSFVPKDIDLVGQSVRVDELGSTSRPGVFACGDLVEQPRSVAHAIGSGKKAAVAIDGYCKGLPRENTLGNLRVGEKGNLSFRSYLGGKAVIDQHKVIHFEDLNPSYFQYRERTDKPKLPVHVRSGFEEVFGNLSEKQALGEAHRCFSCGMCYHCDNCYLFCPDASVLKGDDETYNRVNYDYCKGCGICENECPVGVIEMETED